MPRIPHFRIIALLFAIAPSAFAAAQSPAYQYFRIGNRANSTTAIPHAGYALMGGGTDLDQAFRWLCARSGGGDFLVLRAHGNDDYIPYIQKLCHLNSVATLIIPSRVAANDAFVADAIRHATALFIAGGDQANYINFWERTPVQDALNDAIRRGIPIGGTSAGLAVLGEYAYTAQGDKPDDKDLDSKTALNDPYHPRITLDDHFLRIPILEHILTDTHFARRDRMGRLLVFLARENEPDGVPLPPDRRVRGLGVEQGAAVLVEPDGSASVIGHGSAYFVTESGNAEVLQPGKPLNLRNIAVEKVEAGHSFNLKTWQGDATRYRLTVEGGLLHSTQSGGAIY